MLQMLKDSLIRQPTEEDPDEGIKDIVEIALKKMVLLCIIKLTCYILPLYHCLPNTSIFFFSGLWPWWESFLFWFWEDGQRWKPFTTSFWQLPPRCKGRNHKHLFVHLHVKCIVILKGRLLNGSFICLAEHTGIRAICIPGTTWTLKRTTSFFYEKKEKAQLNNICGWNWNKYLKYCSMWDHDCLIKFFCVALL